MGVLADSGGAIGSLFFLLIYVAVIVLWIAGMWKTFEKAGQKGWLAIIPILNTYVLIKLAGREGWTPERMTICGNRSISASCEYEFVPGSGCSRCRTSYWRARRLTNLPGF